MFGPWRAYTGLGGPLTDTAPPARATLFHGAQDAFAPGKPGLKIRAMAVTLTDVRGARRRISGGVIVTPCPESIPLSEITGARIVCKLEDFQRTGSLKERGARNALLQLPVAQKRRGVVAASAGNQALGLRIKFASRGLNRVMFPERWHNGGDTGATGWGTGADCDRPAGWRC